MRVVFDYQIFSAQKYGGISRYFVELASNLANMHDTSVQIISPIHINDHLLVRSSAVGLMGIKVPLVRHVGRLYQNINKAIARPLIALAKPNLVHETYYSSQATSHTTCRRILTVFDMINESFPMSFRSNDSTARDKAAAVERADHIICISEHTRQDLIRILGVTKEKTSVIHLGFTLGNIRSQFHLSKNRPFLLYVGSRGGYKNFDGLLRAYAASASLMDCYDLVAFGGGGLTSKEAVLARKLGIPVSNLRQISGGDDVLEYLYRHASLFVYPSLYEGFGIPPLEAMSFSCPVVCSNTSSMPEVVGDAAVFFDPNSPSSILQAIESVLNNGDLRMSLINGGQARIKHFSWQRCAIQTLEVYRRVLS